MVNSVMFRRSGEDKMRTWENVREFSLSLDIQNSEGNVRDIILSVKMLENDGYTYDLTSFPCTSCRKEF